MYKRKKTMGSLPENNVSSNIDFMSKIHQNDHHTFGFNIPFDPGNPGCTHLRFLALFLLISIGYAILWRGKLNMMRTRSNTLHALCTIVQCPVTRQGGLKSQTFQRQPQGVVHILRKR